MPYRLCLKPICLIVFFTYSICAKTQKIQPQTAFYNQKLQSSSLLFMENKGQVADVKGNLRPDILFTANSSGTKIYLSANAIHYQFTKTEYPEGYDPFSREPAKDPEKEEALKKQIKTSTHRFTVELQDANLHPVISKQQQSSYFENYYLTQCPDGITGVRGYEKIVYENVYPNIDWVLYSKGGYMEYDFLVHPGGNPEHIKLKVTDAESASITATGELLMKTGLGEVREKAPVSYSDGIIISSNFKQNGDGTIGFDVQPQPGKELRIDPSIIWSTYYGGTGHEGGCYCALDGNGNVYLNGITWSASGVASGGFQNTFGGGFGDAFLVKFNSAGTRMWATYYGGGGDDNPGAFVTDNSGNTYMSGNTTSVTGIASGGFQNSHGGGLTDAFLVKFNTSGVRMWSTYYGGNLADGATCCTLDVSGNVYLTGSTKSTNTIASGGFQNTSGGGNDAFLVKFNASGSRLWGTYYGGSIDDLGLSCSVDNSGNVYMAGQTSSNGLASGGFQNTNGGGFNDAFLVKFTTNGNRIWATYYGGEGSDWGSSCSVDNNDNVYLCGQTSSLTNIAAGGFQNTYGGSFGGSYLDAYLVKFTSSGNRLWATYYGGNGDENFTFCTTNAVGSVYMTGQTGSPRGIAFNGFQNAISMVGTIDSYIVKFNSNGSRAWGSYFGGLSYESAGACVADINGDIYISGHTGSSVGIAFNGFQNTISNSGSYDGYLAKIADEALCIGSTLPTVSATSDTICSGSSTTISIMTGNLNGASQWQWHKDSCNGAIVGAGTSVLISPAITTTYYVRGEGGCAAPGNCVSKIITVNPVVMPTVVLTANPAGVIIAGTSVTFTATPTNFGTSPSFAFKINGTTVQNGGNNFYTANTLINGDVVTVTLTSNAICTSTSTANSNGITMVVITPCIGPSIPAIATTALTVCSGSSATLSIATGNLNSAAQWTWYTDSCGGTALGTGTSITVSPAASTTYYVRGEGGCVTPGNCAAIIINVNALPIASFVATPASVCSGDTITITYTGNASATATYSWNWGGGTVIKGSHAGPFTVRYTTSGTISLTVSNGSCAAIATTQLITVSPKPLASFTVSDTMGCNNLRVTCTNTSVSGTSWQWNFGDATSSTDFTPPLHHYPIGVYPLSLTATNDLCSHTTTKIIRVVDGPIASFSAIPGVNTPLQLSQANISFTNTSQNATQYIWDFGDATGSSVQHSSHRYQLTGSYAVRLYAYNNAGCVDTLTQSPFLIVPDSELKIPTAFTPNNDGINDTWIINGLQNIANSKVSIFNRWGQSVFNSNGYNKPWEGNFKGKPLPVDTYYYVITINKRSYTGSVMLLR